MGHPEIPNYMTEAIGRESSASHSSSFPFKRALLAAVLSFAHNAFVVSASAASPMVDGPMVCQVDGDTTPRALNPDPLRECPQEGDWVRMASGQYAEDYFTRNYPDGFETGPRTEASVGGSAEAGVSPVEQCDNPRIIIINPRFRGHSLGGVESKLTGCFDDLMHNPESSQPSAQ